MDWVSLAGGEPADQLADRFTEPMGGSRPEAHPSEANTKVWQTGNYVSSYARRELMPAEILIMVRYQAALSRRVLDVGCGGGRLLGYLSKLGAQSHGVDISPSMVEHCRKAYPEADVRVGDLAALHRVVEGPFDAILMMDNLIDIYADAERRAVLAGLRELISADGLLIFSSHNLDHLDDTAGHGQASRALELLTKIVDRPPADVLRATARIPRRVRNRRRLAPFQRRERDHAIINDSAHDYGLLHYYIRHDDQARQLEETGYELVECLDGDGEQVAPGRIVRSSALHYIARPA